MSIYIYIMDMKRHMFIFLFLSMLVGRKKGEIVRIENKVGMNCF